MREIRLTPQAEADLAEIRRYSKKVGGASGARLYLKGLGRRLEQLAAGTVVHRDAEIGDGYRRCRYERHVIIFKEEADSIRVVHVFHERMDIAERVGTRSDDHSTQSSPISR